MDAGAGAGLSERDKRLWLAGALTLLVALVIGVTVLGGGGDDGDAGPQTADGVLTEVAPDRLEMELGRPVDGRTRLSFVVRAEDRATLDIPHLRLHAQDALPTRIYYERDGEDYVARRAEDLRSLR